MPSGAAAWLVNSSAFPCSPCVRLGCNYCPVASLPCCESIPLLLPSSPCRAVEAEVKLLCEGALAVARDVVSANLRRHTDLSAQLRQEERVEGAALQVGGVGSGGLATP